MTLPDVGAFTIVDYGTADGERPTLQLDRLVCWAGTATYHAAACAQGAQAALFPLFHATCALGAPS